jgi:undecaprenyl diphosphate synthase
MNGIVQVFAGNAFPESALYNYNFPLPMSLKDKIDITALPRHIAVIMDGNGRWARKKGNVRVFGHKSAIKAVRDTTEAAAELGIEYLTLFAFSTENWNRPQFEVDALMKLLVSTIRDETPTLQKNEIKLNAIGNLDDLPAGTRKELSEAIEITRQNRRMTLTLALSYGARSDLTLAFKKVARLAREGKIDPEKVDDQTVSRMLSTSEIPDPELLIRTSGEYRISNFLLWEIAYAEIFFTPTLWPDFRRENLYEAIIDFQKRERRFGMISEQIH